MKKVALITGAGRGIGLGIAQALAGDPLAPCDIAILDVHPDEAVNAALGKFDRTGAGSIKVALPGTEQPADGPQVANQGQNCWKSRQQYSG